MKFESIFFGRTGRQPLFNYLPAYVPQAGVGPAQVYLQVFETTASTDSAIGA